ncbi:unnamed protein product [Vitrella brassicaformis CCMP3155]|uniref:J domain-containing protein n=2 Tax=Vitrella brassicaformis TaxID=1169539 RepID=A0A0G4GNS9_VITBC|nr:unnamed protein product [Vitrella brassicaformis CCMP3155]|eukprot:CEM31934.1 unnamed protein product [Vitrella brassicaformis CCMP3155]
MEAEDSAEPASAAANAAPMSKNDFLASRTRLADLERWLLTQRGMRNLFGRLVPLIESKERGRGQEEEEEEEEGAAEDDAQRRKDVVEIHMQLREREIRPEAAFAEVQTKISESLLSEARAATMRDELVRRLFTLSQAECCWWDKANFLLTLHHRPDAPVKFDHQKVLSSFVKQLDQYPPPPLPPLSSKRARDSVAAQVVDSSSDEARRPGRAAAAAANVNVKRQRVHEGDGGSTSSMLQGKGSRAGEPIVCDDDEDENEEEDEQGEENEQGEEDWGRRPSCGSRPRPRRDGGVPSPSQPSGPSRPGRGRAKQRQRLPRKQGPQQIDQINLDDDLDECEDGEITEEEGPGPSKPLTRAEAKRQRGHARRRRGRTPSDRVPRSAAKATPSPIRKRKKGDASSGGEEGASPSSGEEVGGRGRGRRSPAGKARKVARGDGSPGGMGGLRSADPSLQRHLDEMAHQQRYDGYGGDMPSPPPPPPPRPPHIPQPAASDPAAAATSPGPPPPIPPADQRGAPSPDRAKHLPAEEPQETQPTVRQQEPQEGDHSGEQASPEPLYEAPQQAAEAEKDHTKAVTEPRQEDEQTPEAPPEHGSDEEPRQQQEGMGMSPSGLHVHPPDEGPVASPVPEEAAQGEEACAAAAAAAAAASAAAAAALGAGAAGKPAIDAGETVGAILRERDENAIAYLGLGSRVAFPVDRTVKELRSFVTAQASLVRSAIQDHTDDEERDRATGLLDASVETLLALNDTVFENLMRIHSLSSDAVSVQSLLGLAEDTPEEQVVFCHTTLKGLFEEHLRVPPVREAFMLLTSAKDEYDMSRQKALGEDPEAEKRRKHQAEKERHERARKHRDQMAVVRWVNRLPRGEQYHFWVLGLDARFATDEMVKANHRKLQLMVHPDKINFEEAPASEKQEATQAITRVNESYAACRQAFHEKTRYHPCKAVGSPRPPPPAHSGLVAHPSATPSPHFGHRTPHIPGQLRPPFAKGPAAAAAPSTASRQPHVRPKQTAHAAAAAAAAAGVPVGGSPSPSPFVFSGFAQPAGFTGFPRPSRPSTFDYFRGRPPSPFLFGGAKGGAAGGGGIAAGSPVNLDEAESRDKKRVKMTVGAKAKAAAAAAAKPEFGSRAPRVDLLSAKAFLSRNCIECLWFCGPKPKKGEEFEVSIYGPYDDDTDASDESQHPQLVRGDKLLKRVTLQPAECSVSSAADDTAPSNEYKTVIPPPIKLATLSKVSYYAVQLSLTTNTDGHDEECEMSIKSNVKVATFTLKTDDRLAFVNSLPAESVAALCSEYRVEAGRRGVRMPKANDKNAQRTFLREMLLPK